jgi:hypothetical protein
MLHAVIRSGREALHFFGEVNPYNLQTLRDHVRQSVREHQPVQVRVEIDPRDRLAFDQLASKWLLSVQGSGAAVEIAVAQPQ